VFDITSDGKFPEIFTGGNFPESFAKVSLRFSRIAFYLLIFYRIIYVFKILSAFPEIFITRYNMKLNAQVQTVGSLNCQEQGWTFITIRQSDISARMSRILAVGKEIVDLLLPKQSLLLLK
jgi:hypothetical protein